MLTTTFSVMGLTGQDSVTVLTEEIKVLPGVESVVVDLVVGGESRLMITGRECLEETTVGLAVGEAGFELLKQLS